MTCATAVEAEWLAAAAPTFFALRYPTHTELFKKVGNLSIEQENNTKELKRAMELEMQQAMELKRASQLRKEQSMIRPKTEILFAGAHSALRPKASFRSVKRGSGNSHLD